MSGTRVFPIKGDEVLAEQRGLSKRELFAAMVLGHILQMDGIAYLQKNKVWSAESAVELADALIAALAKEKPCPK